MFINKHIVELLGKDPIIYPVITSWDHAHLVELIWKVFLFFGHNSILMLNLEVGKLL